MTKTITQKTLDNHSVQYVIDNELAKIINVSMLLEIPLLLKGEPGTGKTMLAHAISKSLQMPLIVLNVKSSMKLVDALYQYDTLTRLNDSRFGDSERDVSKIKQYIKMGKIGQSFTSEKRTVLLIDEIDKADTDFQDDMLDVLDQMEFDIMETDETIKTLNRPVIIITSNAKKDLSDPFLGRCNFHHIAFPTHKEMETIINIHFPMITSKVINKIISIFYELRELIKKIPSDKILIETDSPYLVPTPEKNKTKRNEPSFIKNILLKISEIRKEDPKSLSKQIWDNTCNFFKISSLKEIKKLF